MKLSDFRPVSKLVTPVTLVEKPRYPVVDAHNHLAAPFGGGWIDKALNEIHAALDEAGVSHLVDLDGGWGEDILQRHLDKLSPSPRFHIFGGVDWAKWAEMGDAFPEYATRRLEVQKSWGAQGLKIWKPFGLQVKDHLGQLVRVDDARLQPLWQTAANLGLPVLIHVADPVAFFDPIDERNERWDEIGGHPDWAFTSPPYPPFLSILEGLYNLVKNNLQTQFIGAHVGCYAENLAWVGNMLDDCPNFSVDISARIAELGRQPYTARRFCIKYSDRIVFGLDAGIDLAMYRIYYRFLETEDEYFNPNPGDVPFQGRWFIYGLNLPDEVLKKIYFQNAARLLKIKEVNA
jgi:predicted TIM-barrel fold metal-dependent hydrolase